MRRTWLFVFGSLMLSGSVGAPSLVASPGEATSEGAESERRSSLPLDVDRAGGLDLRRARREQPRYPTGAMPGLANRTAPTEPFGRALGAVPGLTRRAWPAERSRLALGAVPGLASRAWPAEPSRLALGAVRGSMSSTWLVEPSSSALGAGMAPRRRSYFSVMGYHMLILQRGHQPKLNAGVVDRSIAGALSPRLSGRASPSFHIQDGGADVDLVYGCPDTGQTARFASGRFGKMLPFAVLFNQGGPQMSLTRPVVLSTAADTGNAWTPAAPLSGAELGFVSRPGWSVYLGAGQARGEGGNAATRSLSFYASREWKRWRDGNLPPDNHQTGVYGSADYLWGHSGNSVTLYGYWGRATLPAGGARRGLHRLGAFANVHLPQTKLAAGYLTGKDTAADGRSLEIPGFFVLAERLLTDRWAVYGRYDGLRRDLDAGGSQHITGPTLGVSWWMQTQMRLTVEGQLLSISAERNDRRLVTGLFWIF